MSRDDDTESTELVHARTLRVLSWGALLFVVLLGASMLQCISDPSDNEHCARSCVLGGGKLKTFTAAQAYSEPDPGSPERTRTVHVPAKCECLTASPTTP